MAQEKKSLHVTHCGGVESEGSWPVLLVDDRDRLSSNRREDEADMQDEGRNWRRKSLDWVPTSAGLCLTDSTENGDPS